MRKLCFIVIVLVMFPAFGSADTIYSVDITSYFAAKNSCSSNCLETISASFQYDWGGYIRGLMEASKRFRLSFQVRSHLLRKVS